MFSENLEDVQMLLNLIDIEDEPGSEKNNIYSSDHFKYCYKPQPALRYIPKNKVVFEQYIKEICHNKIQILNRDTFNEIKRPIFIMFNHFHNKCAYHTKWLDRLYQLALKYGDRIEFIAADMVDMDVMYPGRNPINFFCRLIKAEHEYPNTFAIDERKRIYQHFDAYKTEENLSEVCENLLNGNLFPSQPMPQHDKSKLVKICVHQNYEELVLKSSKNIFLIINLEKYQQYNEPNYENVALALKEYNLDIVYMEAEKNYLPFEYHANCYPTILFIPCNDKNNFIYYENLRHEHLIIEFLKNIMDHTEVLQLKQQDLKSRMLQKSVEVPNDFQIDFTDLPQYLQQNFNNKYKVLNRQYLDKFKRCYFIVFMDFSHNKCLAHHIEWLNKIYQLVESSYSIAFIVADFKDIDIINTKWKPNEIRDLAQGRPRIYAIDYQKHTYEYGNFLSAADLFYFTESITSREFYFSQLYCRKNLNEKVKVWTADHFNRFLKSCKQHIFLTFYSSEDENAEKISILLQELADDVCDLNVEIAKFDVQNNYVDLEYAKDRYPVHYFIPNKNKKSSRIYINRDLNRELILEFITSNL